MKYGAFLDSMSNQKSKINPLQSTFRNPKSAMGSESAPPEVHTFNLYGETVNFDSNSLKVACAAQNGSAPAVSVATARPVFKLSKTTPVRRVILNVTHCCNLACSYCFAAKHLSAGPCSLHFPSDQSDKSDRSDESALTIMPLETARRAISLLDPRFPLDIGFFGGEPLLAWPLIRAVMEETQALAARRNTGCKFHITTNGTLLDEEKLRELKGINCSLLISLDGPAHIHNQSRPIRNPKSEIRNSFAATMAAIERTAALLRPPMVRATFDTASDIRLVERLEFFAGLQDAGLISGFSIEPAIMGEGCGGRGTTELTERTENERNTEDGLSRETIKTPFSVSSAASVPPVVKEYHSAAQWYVARIRAGKPAGFFHFRKILDRIHQRRHAGSECGAGNGYITVSPDGTIHACHREGTPIGHVERGFDIEARSAWRDNRVCARSECMRCWARYLCGGGCRQARLELGGSINAAIPEVCALHKTMIKECLWILTQVAGRAAANHPTDLSDPSDPSDGSDQTALPALAVRPALVEATPQ